MEIKLVYNPYKLETIITVNDTEIKDAVWDKYRHERIQVWVEKLFELIEEQVNTKQFHFIFQGTMLDYEDVHEQIEICNGQMGYQIEAIHLPAKQAEDKVTELRELFKDIQEGPFEDLKDSVIKKNFEAALGDEFEVSVIATMSSGKSTLINSFLGKEIMPSKNEACTATVSRIKDTPGKTQFSAVCKDKHYNTIDSTENLSKLMMESWNREEVATIEIEGEIPSIESKNIKLVLVDTPGPNNSKTVEHKEHTYKLIRDAAKPMVMYILNATQLQTNDDNALLSAVANEMSIDGKQSKDRFLFVINKMDQFDPDNDDIPAAIDNVKQYLEKHGIYNPNIYPASAELAKVIRMDENREVLTRHQRQTLNKVVDFIEVDQYHFTEYSSLSPYMRKKIEKELQEAINQGDDMAQALIHSGVPAIESAINEYLEKYAYTAKLKNAVDTFKKKIEEKELMGNMTATLKNDEQARKDLLAQMQAVKEIINSGNKAKEFKDKIRDIQFNDFKTKEMKRLVAKVNAKISDLSYTQKAKVEAYEAQTIVKRAKDTIENLSLDIKQELKKGLDESVKTQASRYVEEYKHYVQGLLQRGVLKEEGYTSNVAIKILETDIPNPDQLIQQYKYTEKVVTGQEWVDNQDFRWWNPFSWKMLGGDGRGKYRDIKEDREYVEIDSVMDSLLTPVRTQFDDNFTLAIKHAEEEAEKLKEFFIKQMEQIDKVISNKLDELEKLSSDSAYLDKQIRDNTDKMAWLEEIITRLNTILDI